MPSLIWVGIIQSLRAWKEQKVKEGYIPLLLPSCTFELRHRACGLGLAFTPSATLLLAWNYITSFSGSPTCKWHIMDLSLYDQVSQFLIILFIYIHVYIYMCIYTHMIHIYVYIYILLVIIHISYNTFIFYYYI